MEVAPGCLLLQGEPARRCVDEEADEERGRPPERVGVAGLEPDAAAAAVPLKAIHFEIGFLINDNTFRHYLTSFRSEQTVVSFVSRSFLAPSNLCTFAAISVTFTSYPVRLTVSSCDRC